MTDKSKGMPDQLSESKDGWKSLKEELTESIKKHSRESGCNTPDFILAEYLMGCLEAFEKATNTRTGWFGKEKNLKSEFKNGKQLAEKLIDHLENMGGAAECQISFENHLVKILQEPPERRDTAFLKRIRTQLHELNKLTNELIRQDKIPYQNILDEYSFVTEKWMEIQRV